MFKTQQIEHINILRVFVLYKIFCAKNKFRKRNALNEIKEKNRPIQNRASGDFQEKI